MGLTKWFHLYANFSIKSLNPPHLKQIHFFLFLLTHFFHSRKIQEKDVYRSRFSVPSKVQRFGQNAQWYRVYRRNSENTKLYTLEWTPQQQTILSQNKYAINRHKIYYFWLSDTNSIFSIFCLHTDRQRISNSSQTKVTKMLLIVSTVFVLLNSPSYAFRIIAYLVVSARDSTVDSFIFWFQTTQSIRTGRAREKLFTIHGHSAVYFAAIVSHEFRHKFHALLYEWSKFSVHLNLIRNPPLNDNNAKPISRKEFIQLFRNQPKRQPEGGTQVTGAVLPSETSKKRTVTRNVSWNDTYELRSMTISSK